MHKKLTHLKHSILANDLMSYIYDNIQSDINMDEMANNFSISKCHFHKIFKEQTGMAIYETIKSIRLQKASNILITNKYSNISEIANMCGYSSQTSFIRAFKQRFSQTPTYWRKGGYKEYSNKIINAATKNKKASIDFYSLEQNLIKVKPRMAYYIRQKGYSANYKQTWEKLKAWVYSNDIKEYEQIGIYHDNPTLTPLEECNYVACIVPKDENLRLSQTNLPQLEIQECLCITFKIECLHEDILLLIQWVYHEWLPTSGYETITIPSYIIKENEDFSSSNNIIKGIYHVPVRYV